MVSNRVVVIWRDPVAPDTWHVGEDFGDHAFRWFSLDADAVISLGLEDVLPALRQLRPGVKTPANLSLTLCEAPKA